MLRQAARTPALHLGSTFIESTAERQRYIAHSHFVCGTYPFRPAETCQGPRLRARKDFLSSKSNLERGVLANGEADGKRQVKSSSMKRSVARAHRSMTCFIAVAYLTESIQTYCVSCHIMYRSKQDFGTSHHCYWTRRQAHHVIRPGESSSFIPWFSPAVLL